MHRAGLGTHTIHDCPASKSLSPGVTGLLLPQAASPVPKAPGFYAEEG